MTQEPRIPVRRQAVPSRQPLRGPAPKRARPGISHILVGALFGLFLIGSVTFVAGALATDPTRTQPPSVSPGPGETPLPGTSGDPTATGPVGSGGPGGSPGPGETPGATLPPGETPAPTAEPTPGPIGELAMPMVPVVRFWSTAERISRADLEAAVRGETQRRVVVSEGDLEAVAQALGVRAGADVEQADAAGIRDAVREGALGIMRAADVTPAVKALGIGDASLFGNARIRDVSRWPLTVTVTDTADRAWDQARTWTLVAGGDILLDRGVYVPVKIKGKGPDYLFDGGNAEITGRTCCSPFFNDTYVIAHQTGGVGRMRAMLTDADLAIANLENPTPKNAVFHLHGTVFTGHPFMVPAIKRAGIDFLSLANNHLYDAGPIGITQTRQLLTRLGIPFSGAGADLEEAQELVVLEAGGQRVALVTCNDIAKYIWAKRNKPGTAPCKDEPMVRRIAEARAQADVVIVFPHWGVEYTTLAYPSQREHARVWIEAGADLIVGAHSHWAGTIEEMDGKLVFYSLGNFVFDQWFTEETSEGIVPEMTWYGNRLVQAWVHPTLILDQGQPNFLDPAGDGKVVIKRVREASEEFLPY